MCVLVDVTKEERDVLLRWKKRSDSFVLVRLKAEAVLYASRGVDVSIIAEMVDRSERTVRDWLANWRLTRLCSVVTGHASNENAAKLTRAQKEQLKETLSRPPSQSGIRADFWDVPALRDVVKILFDVEYQSDSTYQEGYSVAKIQRDDFRSRYLNFFEVTKDSNASQVSSKKALCLLLMEFLPSFQTFSMGFLSGL